MTASGTDLLNHPAQAILLCVDKPETANMWAQQHFNARQQSFAGQLLRCELKPEKNSFKIEQSRELLQMCATQPPPGQGLWVWLNQVECFTPEAANAILKLLEEPWQRQWFLLSTSRLSAVLPTIRSRCVMVRSPHVVDTPAPVPHMQKLINLSAGDRLVLAETLGEDEAEGKVFLQQWLGHLRWCLHAGEGNLSDILAQSDDILRVLSHWGRPIQKRLALESLFFQIKK